MKARSANLKRLPRKSCKEIADLVSNYLNNSLQPRLKQQFEEHLKICPDCMAFLKTFRKTVALVHSVDAADMPEDVQRNIWNFLRNRARTRKRC